MLVQDFILPHAFEFYRTAETVTDGDRLQRICSWIITVKLERISSRDLTRNVRDLRGLSVFDLNKRVSPLVAGGWLTPSDIGPVCRAWTVNAGVFDQFEARARDEEQRKAALAELMSSPRKRAGC